MMPVGLAKMACTVGESSSQVSKASSHAKNPACDMPCCKSAAAKQDASKQVLDCCAGSGHVVRSIPTAQSEFSASCCVVKSSGFSLALADRVKEVRIPTGNEVIARIDRTLFPSEGFVESSAQINPQTVSAFHDALWSPEQSRAPPIH